MRKTTLLLTTLLLLAVTAPAQAQAPVGCATVNIEWIETTNGHQSPKIASYTADDGVGTAIVGGFLWLRYTNQPGDQDTHATTVSVRIPDGAVTMTGCTAFWDWNQYGDMPQGQAVTGLVVGFPLVDDGVTVAQFTSVTPDMVAVLGWVTAQGFEIG